MNYPVEIFRWLSILFFSWGYGHLIVRMVARFEMGGSTNLLVAAFFFASAAVLFCLMAILVLTLPYKRDKR